MIRSRRQLYFITWCTACRRYLFEQNKDSSRYLEFRGWHTGSLFIVEQNCDDDQDTVMHVDKPRMEYTRGIETRERRMARVIRRIDHLVFVPERNLSTSSFASPSSSWSLGERERQSIPGEAGDGEAGEVESLHSTRRNEKARGRKDGRGVVGWRLIFCSLASASSSASGRPHFARAAQGGEGPSIILSFLSLTSLSSPSPPLHLPTLCFSLWSFPISRIHCIDDLCSR